MRSLIMIIPIFLISLSCSSFGTTTEIDKSSTFTKLHKIGVMLRMSARSKVAREDVVSNLSGWLNGYKQLKKVSLIPNTPVALSEYSSDDKSFYQISSDDEYQKYKTNGTIKQYVIDNTEKLQDIFKNEGLDLLVIYEIDSNYSSELKYTKLNTLVLILNNKLEPVYLTYNSDNELDESIDYTEMKSNTLDKISNRLIDEFDSLDFIEKF